MDKALLNKIGKIQIFMSLLLAVFSLLTWIEYRRSVDQVMGSAISIVELAEKVFPKVNNSMEITSSAIETVSKALKEIAEELEDVTKTFKQLNPVEDGAYKIHKQLDEFKIELDKCNMDMKNDLPKTLSDAHQGLACTKMFFNFFIITIFILSFLFFINGIYIVKSTSEQK